MFHQKWPAPPFSGKLRKILDRSVTPDPSKDVNEQTELPVETNARPLSPSSATPQNPPRHIREHHSFAETNSQAAFSHALHHEFNDLFFFACNKTFSGENVLFLRLVQCWKACWSLMISLNTDETRTIRQCADIDTECPLRRKVFSVAVEMYYDFINPSTARRLLLNLEYGLAAPLETVLGDAARTIPTGIEHERATAVAPFVTPDGQEDMAGYSHLLGLWWDLVSNTDESSNNNNEENLHEKPLPALPNNTSPTHSFHLLKMESRVSQAAVIPEAFCRDIFDKVESSVYLMVLRDTFPKYVSWRKLKDAESGNQNW
ncbi:hypothetical protein PISL3812_03306 [Talaromyces islandicus]|uniref:RGS domain-containing protein n=1 Tax=Talaromyces islandicus TaxID=28573 RepID=A0A0U1LUJ5_TALIS|nr:hypothetical protein PISL3812_03306 [Talaromyces islandicus]